MCIESTRLFCLFFDTLFHVLENQFIFTCLFSEVELLICNINPLVYGLCLHMDSYANRYRNIDFLSFIIEIIVLHRCADALKNGADRLGASGQAFLRLTDQYELLTAPPARRQFSAVAHDEISHAFQHIVAAVVSVGIINPFEIINVYNCQPVIRQILLSIQQL